MRAIILQHVPFEGPGCIEAWLNTRGASIRTIRLFAEDPLPHQEEIDLLIAMGGPMSVNDEAIYPWLAAEKRLIARVIAAGKPVLGICLGAQLMAAALGARVYAAPCKEIGWFPIHAVTALGDQFAFPPKLDVFHWHGETFELPAGATLLASSQGCRHQAFQIGPRAIGLQCHLEITPQSAASLIAACKEELQPGQFVQDEASLLATPFERYAPPHALMGQLLDYLLRAPE